MTDDYGMALDLTYERYTCGCEGRRNADGKWEWTVRCPGPCLVTVLVEWGDDDR